MDYTYPVEAVIPGVQGRVLGLLSRIDGEMTMRSVARLTGASRAQVNEVLGSLKELGIVERREVGRSALVQLSQRNAAAQLVRRLAAVGQTVLDQLRVSAQEINPAPLTLVLFGSFARGQAHSESDLDILAVRAAGVNEDNEPWMASLHDWADSAMDLAGNAVNLLDLPASDLEPTVRLSGPLWSNILRDGITLAGRKPEEFKAAIRAVANADAVVAKLGPKRQSHHAATPPPSPENDS